MKPLLPAIATSLAALLLTLLPACETPQTKSTAPQSTAPQPKTTTAPAPTFVSTSTRTHTPVALPTLHINAGSEKPLTDAKGTTWTPDANFDGGTPVDRSDATVTGTDHPEPYKTERYGMNAYSFKLPNGTYSLKLHFAENYDGITDATGRVFTYTVLDGDAKSTKIIQQTKDFSPWKAAGGPHKAYVDTIKSPITTGQLTITFTPQTQNPLINALEITPE
jgi:hypothetical protein